MKKIRMNKMIKSLNKIKQTNYKISRHHKSKCFALIKNHKKRVCIELRIRKNAQCRNQNN